MTPELLHNEKRLTLYQINAELLELIELREEMTAEGATAEDLDPVNKQIAVYVAQNLQKVDDIRSLMKHCRMMGEAAREEAQTQARRAHVWENRLDTLKDLCKVAMQGWDKKKLEGRTGSIILKGDGGKQALTITDESLIPDEMCEWKGTLTNDRFQQILIQMQWWPADIPELVRTPNNAAIRKALESGEVAGARLEPRSQHVEVK